MSRPSGDRNGDRFTLLRLRSIIMSYGASVPGLFFPSTSNSIASYIANEPFRGQRGQQTRLEQPCLRLKLEHWQCRYQ